jgi:hypothetical protein
MRGIRWTLIVISLLGAACARPRAGPALPLPTPADAGTPEPVVPVAGWALEYTDADEARDRAADAGAHACTPEGRRVVEVRFEANAQGAVLAIPALGSRDRLWKADSNSPSSCSSTETGGQVRFSCREDLASIAGRIFRDGEDLVIAMTTPEGRVLRRLALPCGATVTFHTESFSR